MPLIPVNNTELDSLKFMVRSMMLANVLLLYDSLLLLILQIDWFDSFPKSVAQQGFDAGNCHV